MGTDSVQREDNSHLDNHAEQRERENIFFMSVPTAYLLSVSLPLSLEIPQIYTIPHR